MTKTEAQTRKDLIDRKLKDAGWNITNRTQVIEEFDIELIPSNRVAEPANPFPGHQFCDYVLLGKDGKPLAVIEAKKTRKWWNSVRTMKPSASPNIGKWLKRGCSN